MDTNEKDAGPASIAKDEQLRAMLEEKSGLTVKVKGANDYIGRHCYRYYFEKPEDGEWTYILDVYQGDIDEQTANELFGYLEKAKWLRVLQTNAGKRIPFFMDKKFAVETFQPWPTVARGPGSRK